MKSCVIISGKIKIIALFLIFLPIATAHASHIQISDWQEKAQLTNDGKNSRTVIKGKIAGLTLHQAITAFSISFDQRRQIKIDKVLAGTTPVKYSFKSNILNIRFPKAKRNGDELFIYFAYKEKYQDIHHYLRQEIISIPKFAAGAKARVTITFPGHLESATLNPNVTKRENSFIYHDIVPDNGVREIIKLTPSQNIWDIAIKVRLKSNQPLKDLTLTLPNYFKNGGQKVDNIISKSTISPKDWTRKKNGREFKFNTDKTSLVIHSQATISTGAANKTAINRNPYDYLKTDPAETRLLKPYLEKLKKDPKYTNLPIYAKIGKFVHDFITYNPKYIGKLPKITQILKNPTGVCTEYTALFDALARMEGIPSLTVNGAACGEYQKCQGHAWNMIYYDDQWIEVDPTWDLMSGIVSSSHVYFSDTGQGAIAIKYLRNKDMKVDTQMDFDMKKVQ